MKNIDNVILLVILLVCTVSCKKNPYKTGNSAEAVGSLIVQNVDQAEDGENNSTENKDSTEFQSSAAEEEWKKVSDDWFFSEYRTDLREHYEAVWLCFKNTEYSFKIKGHKDVSLDNIEISVLEYVKIFAEKNGEKIYLGKYNINGVFDKNDILILKAPDVAGDLKGVLLEEDPLILTLVTESNRNLFPLDSFCSININTEDNSLTAKTLTEVLEETKKKNTYFSTDDSNDKEIWIPVEICTLPEEFRKDLSEKYDSLWQVVKKTGCSFMENGSKDSDSGNEEIYVLEYVKIFAENSGKKTYFGKYDKNGVYNKENLLMFPCPKVSPVWSPIGLSSAACPLVLELVLEDEYGNCIRGSNIFTIQMVIKNDTLTVKK